MHPSNPSFRIQQDLFRIGDFLELFLTHPGVGEIKGSESIDDCRSNDHAREPLVVSRHHIPRTMLAGCLANHVLVGVLVLIPQAAVRHVRGGKFPVFVGIICPFEEAALLFVLRNMEKEFNDHDAVAAEIAFEAPDVLKTFVPNTFSNKRRWNSLFSREIQDAPVPPGSPRSSCG